MEQTTLRFFSAVHDGFALNSPAQASASQVAVGKRLATEANGPGLDEMARDYKPYVVLDFQWWRETARSQGYLGRLARWEERRRKEIIPYSTVR